VQRHDTFSSATLRTCLMIGLKRARLLAAPSKPRKDAGFRVCVRAALSIRAMGRAGRICAPEGRLRIARRFQRRVKWNTEPRPGGTPESSQAHSLAPEKCRSPTSAPAHRPGAMAGTFVSQRRESLTHPAAVIFIDKSMRRSPGYSVEGEGRAGYNRLCSGERTK
jgi:hypothetical protein